MIYDIFIFLEVLAIIFLILGFFKGNVIFYAISLVLFGLNIFTAYNIEYIVNVVQLNGSITTHLINYVSTSTSYVNVLFFSVNLILLFYDLWMGNAEVKRADDD